MKFNLVEALLRAPFISPETKLQLQVLLGRLTKLQKKVEVEVPSCDLLAFFNSDNKDLEFEGHFEQLIDDLLDGSVLTFRERVTFYWYKPIKEIPDDLVWAELSEEVIDLNTKEGREKGRKYLGYIRSEIKKQLKGTPGTLLSERHAGVNMIGRFKLKPEELKPEKILSVFFFYHDGEGVHRPNAGWRCAAYEYEKNEKSSPGNQFLSSREKIRR